jgi:hypothetical protein
MGAAPNPLAAIMARQMMQKLAPQPPQGGQQAMQGGQPDNPDAAGQQIQSQLAELQGADPNSMMKILNQIKSQLVAIYPRAAFTMPDVATPVAQAQKYCDAAIKACQKAADVAQTVQAPIANNAGQPPNGQMQPQGLQQFAQGAQ